MRAASTKLLKTAVHQDPITTKQGMLQRLFSMWFKGFVYNQIWEDPRVDLKAMQVTQDSRILAISSGGCNILNYLVEKPASVTAVDLNHNHMSLTRLKIAALKHLPSYELFYDFFGYANKRENLDSYQRYIRPHLDPETLHFWEARALSGKKRINYFANDLYRQARFGHFMRLLHKFGKLTKFDPQELLNAKSIEEQEKIFEQDIEPFFEHWFVRGVGNMSFAVFSLGIPPQQYEYMREESEGNLVNLYRERVRRLVCQFPINDNYFAWQGFSLSYDHEKRQAVPDYLKAEHYDTLKTNIDRVDTHLASLIKYLKEQPNASLDRFVLLDSQDWMPPPVMTELWSEMARVGKPGTRIIFRTASPDSPIEIALPSDLRRQFVYEEDLSKTLHEQDRSAIYGGFHVYEKPAAVQV